MMNDNPLVTVYMPTKDRIELLKRAIDSVLNQDYKNVELIVVDDGSTDETVEFLVEKSKSDKRIKYFINTESLGACASRNKAIFSATGEFITGLDDDDYFLPGRLSAFVSAWKNKNKNTVALCANSIAILPTGKSKKTNRPRIIRKKDLIDSNIVGNQIFTKTELLTNAGGFYEEMPAWQDLELWYRLLSSDKNQLECLSEPSYVVDTSHPHERISTGKIEKIKQAHLIFSTRHSLTECELLVMSMQVHMYQPEISPFKMAAAKIKRAPTLRNIKQSFNAVAIYYFNGKSQ